MTITASACPLLDKQAATLQAVAALSGIRIDSIDDDNGQRVWLLSRWNLSRQCRSLDELMGLLQRMGVHA